MPSASEPTPQPVRGAVPGLTLAPAQPVRGRLRWRVLGGLGLACAVALGMAGCSSVAYYAQSVGGHLSLLGQARPISDWLGDESTSDRLRARLVLSQQLRDFAVLQLHLPDNTSYRRYADLGRPAAVWNVVAAPAWSLKLHTWCFLVVGCVAYKGFYALEGAQAEAARLRAEGLEVAILPVPAYSTLGRLPGAFFSDPLLNTFIQYPDTELARLMFHELAHQVAFAPGDTVFNESFATAVERLGLARWMTAHGSDALRAEHQRMERRRADFRRITWEARQALDTLYSAGGSPEALSAGKAQILEALRARHRALKADAWGGFSGYDRWFDSVNNASLGMVGAYNDEVPAFEALFVTEGRDFPRFYQRVQALAALPMAQRQAALRAALEAEPFAR